MKYTRFVSLLAVSALLAASLAGCGSSASSVASSASSEAVSSVAESAVSGAASESAAASSARALEDGTYTAEFDTDSSMFHVNEASDGKGTLTVEDGQMTLHISLQSKKIVNLYVGMAADAPDHEADWLQPTTDTVTYSDGTSEEVYGFDVPVEALDTDFQLAILGTKGKWYDHTVSVRNVEAQAAEAVETPADGSYTCEVTLEGGSGRATVDSPAALTVADGKMTATIVWSSPNYDYMIVDGEKYLPTNTEGNSTFEIPVSALGVPLSVVADTVAMSTPHEIEYTLTFSAPSEN
jgi:heme-binding NEAT domain protein